MSLTSSKDSRPRLRTLKEALKERLSPEQWSWLYPEESEPQFSKSSTEQTP